MATVPAPRRFSSSLCSSTTFSSRNDIQGLLRADLEDYQDYLDDLNDGRDADQVIFLWSRSSSASPSTSPTTQMIAAANPRRLDDVDEVVVLVAEGQLGQVVVVHNEMGIGHRGGQMAMLGPRYNRSKMLEAAK